jgi:hypothetical protein
MVNVGEDASAFRSSYCLQWGSDKFVSFSIMEAEEGSGLTLLYSFK